MPISRKIYENSQQRKGIKGKSISRKCLEPTNKTKNNQTKNSKAKTKTNFGQR